MEITRVSSKGQVVLPRSVRESLNLIEGNVLAVSRQNDFIVLKKVRDPLLEEDIETLKGLEEAWMEVESGRARKRSREDFLKEISKW